MELVQVECPNCGAKLPPRAPEGVFTCQYCSASFQARDVRSARTEAGRSLDAKELARAIVEAQQELAHKQTRAQAQEAAATQAASVRGARRLGCVITLVTLAGALVPLFFTLSSLRDVFSKFGISTPSIGSLTSVGERLMIDASMGPPAVVTIGGEPAVVARTRTPLDGDQLYVEAFGARTGERLWRLGPLGDFAQGYRATHFAAAGGRLIVSDAQSKLRVLDLATGAEQQQLNLTDRVEQMCDAPGEAGERVWFAQVDERSFYFDPQGGALTEAKERPEGCPKHAFRERPETGRVDERGRKAPKAEGTKIEKLFEVDALGVAVGVKSPGTAIPRAVGYAPSSREVAWVEAIPAVDPATYREGSNELAGLAGGRLVALYGEGTKLWRVTALDASTGTRLWDVALRSIFAVDHISGLTVTDDLIYVVRMSSVDVLDAATGARVTTIGDETYEG